MWFRPEVIKTVSWGGDPSKAVQADPGARLQPRRSFALWTEHVRGRSKPWTASDLEAADDLQRRATEVDIERRLVSEQRAVRARDEVIAIVSHDLRSPLSSILIHAELTLVQLSSGNDDHTRQLRESAARVKKSATHMKVMIDDLLDLATIEAQHFALQLQSVESRALVEETLLVALPLADAKRINVAAELIDSPRLEADPKRIFRVLSNLLGNAIKFSPVGGTITVRTERLGGELLITVIDTGPGIPAEAIPHVFDRYWKAQPASPAGSGLGLYIAKGIVEAHGGRIWAESSPDGARLFFTLPLAR
jgi:signal transduction histidine kinase